MRIACAAVIAALAAAQIAFAGSEAPGWLLEASRIPTPKYTGNASAVVLLHECRIGMDAEGKVTTATRRAIRILTREGRSEAIAAEDYYLGSGNVRDLKAWIISPAGETRSYGKKETIDAAKVVNEVYGEARTKLISAGDDAEVNTVFGSESLTEEEALCAQFRWAFQNRLPVVLSRFSATVPREWTVRSVTFNHTPVEAQTGADGYVWSLGELGYVEPEPMSPSPSSLAPWIAVTLTPPSGNRKWEARRFESWAQVGHWLGDIAEPQSKPSEAIIARCRELVQGRAREWARIDAIARYVQSVNYISIQTGIGHGGGFRPHAAADVFAKSYGDCKDKANLMRTMLQAVGVSSYLVPIYSADPDRVRAEWPSPYQFDHCIIAVSVSDSLRTFAVLDHPTLGRLLFFDPTDNATPLGDLPIDEQGSLALVVGKSSGSLVRMPETGPEENGTDRRMEGTLSPGGSLVATLSVSARGQDAAEQRRWYRASSPSDYRKMIEQWIAADLSGARVTRIDVNDQPDRSRFDLNVEFAASTFARSLAGGLLTFRPGIFAQSNWVPIDAGKRRKLPIVLRTSRLTAAAEFRLPQGFEVEEEPDSISASTPYGTYHARFESETAIARFEQELVLRRTTLPPEEAAGVAHFLERVRAGERVSVVLAPR